MIYFNNPTDTEDSRLRLTQRNLALVLDENNRLRAENEELQKAHDNRGRGLWGLVESNNRVIDAQHQRIMELKAEPEESNAYLRGATETAIESGRRIEELCAELEDARAENVRLTGQLHALLATIEKAAGHDR